MDDVLHTKKKTRAR